MKFFKTRVFIATAAFLLGAFSMWIVSHRGLTRFGILMMPHEETRSPFDDPMREMRRLQEEMGRIMGGPLPMERPDFEGGFAFGASDLKEEEDRYLLEIDLGGLKPENFSVQIEGGQLFLEGELISDDQGSSVRSKIQRSFPVPEDVEADRIQIDSSGERLIVILPKRK